MSTLGAVRSKHVHYNVRINCAPRSRTRVATCLRNGTFSIVLLDIRRGKHCSCLRPVVSRVSPGTIVGRCFRLYARTIQRISNTGIFTRFSCKVHHLPIAMSSLQRFRPLLGKLLSRVVTGRVTLRLGAHDVCRCGGTSLCHCVVNLCLRVNKAQFDLNSSTRDVRGCHCRFSSTVTLLGSLNIRRLALFGGRINCARPV